MAIVYTCYTYRTHGHCIHMLHLYNTWPLYTHVTPILQCIGPYKWPVNILMQNMYSLLDLIVLILHLYSIDVLQL